MNRSIFNRAALALACAAALSGCVSMAPAYQRPNAPVRESFGSTPSVAVADDAVPVARLEWRSVFVDPQLQQVIALALDNNRDLRVAMLNIEAARAKYRIQRADLLPSVDATASHSAARSSTPGTGSEVSRSATAQVGFSSWELDLFGRIRSLKDEALQTWLATEQTQRSARMSLVAEVAGDWLTVGAYQQRLALAEQTLASQRESLALTERRHAQGLLSGVDLASLQASVESARADVAAYTTSLAQARNALDLVVGTSVRDDLLPAATTRETDAVALAPLPAELSSAVLLQRPDVLYAEHTLKAANADIGAARAAFFPTISLTASTGSGSDALSSLFDSGTKQWSFAPSISLPIFHAGALKASLDQAKISKDVSVAQYEKAIQSAFSEVADALATRATVDEQRDAQQARVKATTRARELAEVRYRNGIDSRLELLDAQRTDDAAQQDLVTLRLAEATNRVTLYKVLGGGADAVAGSAGTWATGK